ncbi:MAG: peptidylprolyl isomerase [Bryobacteraceae bacterium]|nr:peptidylprolyl isomerase [Bryobacteraceae bacterium]
MRRIFPAVLVALAGVVSCKKGPPANVAATVNDRPITYADLDKQYAAQFSTPTPGANEDLEAIQRLEVLRTMIDNEIMLQRAEKLGLMAQDADVEAKYTELKAPYTQEEFDKQLRSRKLTPAELKTQLRRDLSIQKLFNREISSHITITDKEVADFYHANRESFNLAEPQIRIAQILVTPRADPGLRNLRNDDAQTEADARQKILSLEKRLKGGEDFALLAQSYSEDPATAPNGGDLGFIPESSLTEAHVELRKIVMQLQPGQISPIIRTPEGYRILKLISREPAGQRDLNDPRVQQTIRETLTNRKEQLLRAAYYENARNEARVVNYYARSIYERMTKAGK